VVLTRFYFDVTKNTEQHARDSRAVSVVRKFGNMQIFESVNGFYGISDSSQTVIIEPDWIEIPDITPEMAIVSGRLENTVLTGGIDYEENMILPFVFRSMKSLGDGWHLGIVDADGSCILYDRNYHPVFQESFSEINYQDQVLRTEKDGCIFQYDMSGSAPVLLSAELVSTVLGEYLHWKISNQVYLAELDSKDLRTISHHASAYMQMLEQNDFSALSEIAAIESVSSLTKPGLLGGMQFDSISRFSFSRRESGAYDFSFRLAYQNESAEGTAEVHLYFRKHPEFHMLLTAADLQFKNAEPAALE